MAGFPCSLIDFLLQSAEECDINITDKRTLLNQKCFCFFKMCAAVGGRPQEMALVLSALEEFQ